MNTILRYVLVVAILAPVASSGHHSAAGRYDREAMMDIEGIVTEVLWRNPHAYVIIESTDQSGERTTWDLETSSPTQLSRSGIQPDSIKVGDRIRAAGFPPLTDAREIFTKNILLPSGEELLLDIDAEPRFSDSLRGDNSFWLETDGDSSRPDLGLFRVWSHTFVSPWLYPEITYPDFDLNSYPLTVAARLALEGYDRARDNPTQNCTPKGMPTLMEQPLPMEFVAKGDDILLEIEEYDVVRTIYMNRDTPPSDEPASPFGYSVGRWDGTTLVVTTTRLSWPWFNQLGIPQSSESELVERFSPAEDGSRLDYLLMVFDQVNFTNPVPLTKYWLYRSDEERLPYECTRRAQQ